MIKRLSAKGFTVMRSVSLSFSPCMNVIIGENGAGKTHLIKLLYALQSAIAKYSTADLLSVPSKQDLQKLVAEKLKGVFMPEYLGRLARRKQGRARAEISLAYGKRNAELQFGFATNSKTEVTIGKFPADFDLESAVYFPAKELLSIFPNFVALYDKFHLPYDLTYADTMSLLGLPYLKGKRKDDVNLLLEPIEQAMGGRIRLDPDGKAFHLELQNTAEGGGNMEIDLVAEGWRKLGMLTQVLLNDALREKGCLYWDEPEANLNPKLIKVLASTLFALAKAGRQTFVATHSLFLLRELEYLAQREKSSKSIRYFSITKDGEIEQGNESSALKTVVALEEELDQSERVANWSLPDAD